VDPLAVGVEALEPDRLVAVAGVPAGAGAVLEQGPEPLPAAGQPPAAVAGAAQAADGGGGVVDQERLEPLELVLARLVPAALGGPDLLGEGGGEGSAGCGGAGVPR